LCQVTERPRVRFRILGKSETPEFDCRTTVLATGNNVGVAEDMVRRALFCNLDAMMERPETRDFKDKPVERVKAARGEYIVAILTVIRAYLIAGAPDLKPLASYETWCKMVRGPLMWLGEADPVASMDQVRNEDPYLMAIREFFESDLMMLDTPYTTKQIATMANGRGDEVEDLLKRVGGKNGVLDLATLGLWLKKITGQVVNGKRLFRDISDRQRPKWVLAEV
jgi:putative DNA primase/helicase